MGLEGEDDARCRAISTGRGSPLGELFLLPLLILFVNFIYNEPRSSFAGRLYNQIKLGGFLDNSDTILINNIAKTMVSHTDYVNRVYLNFPPSPQYISIILFYYDKSLPTLLANNCVSIPIEKSIFCDVHLLRSFPDELPLLVNIEAPLGPPFLLQWLIGHEIGHIVLSHRQITSHNLVQMVKGRAANVPIASIEVPSLHRLSDLIKLGNKQKNEADEFALRQMQMNPNRLLHARMAISDAVLWLHNIYTSQN